jgi:hypothetical protein
MDDPMLQHLAASLKEVEGAAAMALRSPSAAEFLTQALELMDMAAGAVDDRKVGQATSDVIGDVEKFLGALASGSSEDVQRKFQAVINGCSMLSDHITHVTSSPRRGCAVNQAEQRRAQSPRAAASRTPQTLPPPVQQQQQQQQRIGELDESALQSIQRQMLGLDDEVDRRKLDAIGVTNFIESDGGKHQPKADNGRRPPSTQELSVVAESKEGDAGKTSRPGSAPLLLKPSAFRDAHEFEAAMQAASSSSASGAAAQGKDSTQLAERRAMAKHCGEEGGGGEEEEEDPLVAWPPLVEAARTNTGHASSSPGGSSSPGSRRSFGGGGGQCHTLAAAAAAADAAAVAEGEASLVGDLGLSLSAVLSLLEQERDRKQSMEISKRLPKFARRDALVAQRKDLAELQSRLKHHACPDLTTCLRNGAIGLLRGSGGGGGGSGGGGGGGGGGGAAAADREAVCRAVDSLGMALRCRSLNPRAFSHALTAASELVSHAVAAVQAHSRRRRVAIAAARAEAKANADGLLGGSGGGGCTTAAAPFTLGSDEGSFSTAGAGGGGEDGGGGGAGLDNPAARRQLRWEQEAASSRSKGGFDVYSRGAKPKVGAAMKEEAKNRRMSERGAVHLSRHCEHEPSFSDVMGLGLSVVRPAALGGTGLLGGGQQQQNRGGDGKRGGEGGGTGGYVKKPQARALLNTATSYKPLAIGGGRRGRLGDAADDDDDAAEETRWVLDPSCEDKGPGGTEFAEQSPSPRHNRHRNQRSSQITQHQQKQRLQDKQQQ